MRQIEPLCLENLWARSPGLERRGHLVATALYYYLPSCITPSSLAFRQWFSDKAVGKTITSHGCSLSSAAQTIAPPSRTGRRRHARRPSPYNPERIVTLRRRARARGPHAAGGAPQDRRTLPLRSEPQDHQHTICATAARKPAARSGSTQARAAGVQLAARVAGQGA